MAAYHWDDLKSHLQANCLYGQVLPTGYSLLDIVEDVTGCRSCFMELMTPVTEAGLNTNTVFVCVTIYNVAQR